MEKEEFVSIANLGFSKFAVSRNGHVWSYRRSKIEREHISDCGYVRVSIQNDDGKWLTYNVHRLVALAFIPNPENKPQVNHIDGNKLNNTVSNLEWATNLENAHHAMTHGLIPHAKLDDKLVHEICFRICTGETMTEIAETLNVPFTSVNAIRCKRTWLHISNMYPFSAKFERSKELEIETVHRICRDLIDLKNVARRASIISHKYGINRDLILKIARGINWKSVSSQYPELFNA